MRCGLLEPVSGSGTHGLKGKAREEAPRPRHPRPPHLSRLDLAVRPCLPPCTKPCSEDGPQTTALGPGGGFGCSWIREARPPASSLPSASRVAPSESLHISEPPCPHPAGLF